MIHFLSRSRLVARLNVAGVLCNQRQVEKLTELVQSNVADATGERLHGRPNFGEQFDLLVAAEMYAALHVQLSVRSD